MAINSNTLNSAESVQELLSQKRMVLVYGQDEGKVKLLVDRFKKHSGTDEINTLCYDYAAIQAQPSLLLDAINTSSLFGDKTTVIVNSVPNTIDVTTLSILQENNPEDATVLLVAGELKPSSNIRSLFEKSQEKVAIACYDDTERDVIALIDYYMKKHGYHCDRAVAAMLSGHLPKNRLCVYRELDKLLLYKGEDKNITPEDITKVVVDQSSLSIDAICVAIAGKNKKETLRLLEKNRENPIQATLMLRSIMYYLTRVIHIKEEVSSGNGSVEQVMSKMKPPVFFKQRDNLARIAKNISYDDALSLLRTMVRIETAYKTSSNGPLQDTWMAMELSK